MESTKQHSTENQEMNDDQPQGVTSSPSQTLNISTHHQSQDHIDLWSRLDQVLETHLRGSWNPDRIQTPRMAPLVPHLDCLQHCGYERHNCRRQ